MNFIFEIIRNLNSYNFIFHLFFLFILSLQTIVSTPYINFIYILGLLIFMRSNQDYSQKTILLLFSFGFYQDLILGYSFGVSSVIFSYFLFLGQLSNIFIGKGGSSFQGYLYLGGLFFYAFIEFFYIFLNFGIVLKIDVFLVNILIVLSIYFFITKVFNLYTVSNAR